MFAFKYTYEHPLGISALADFTEEEQSYLMELAWYVDQHCVYRVIDPTENGMTFKAVWNSVEERDKVYELFPRGLEILNRRGEANIAAGGTFKFEIEEVTE